MKQTAVSLLVHLYTELLRLYPSDFRAEFGEEMTAVFIEHLTDTTQRGFLALMALCLRELLDLPASLWHEHWYSFLGKEEISMNLTNPVNYTNDRDVAGANDPSSWTGILAGILPFFLFGLLYTLKGINYHQPWLGRGIPGELALHLFFFVCLGVGWALRFPRWAYAYLGITLVFSAFLADTATPGLQMFGYTFGRELWGWQAWMPLLALIVLMLLLTRSLRPLRQLFVGMWQDWTRLSFVLYGALTWLIIGVSYDNKSWYDNTIFLPLNMFLLTLVITGGAFFYMWCRRPWRRVVALQLAIILYPPVTAAVEALDGNNFFVSPDSIVAWLFIIIIWFGVMFMPGVPGLVHRAVRSNHFA